MHSSINQMTLPISIYIINAGPIFVYEQEDLHG